ncbi:MAG: hypothetical protein ACLU4P_08995 [Ruminococcus sp.]
MLIGGRSGCYDHALVPCRYQQATNQSGLNRSAVKAGRCIHLLNTNIQSNAITNYSYRIQPQSSGTRYDIVYAYGGEAEALKGARTDSGQIINNTYIKSSTSSNQGMIASP